MISPPDPGEFVVTMPDGTRLGGLLWRVRSAVGIVLIRTPYDARRHIAVGRSWAARGFHCLVQDVRGRYSSNGEWDPYQNEEADGTVVVLRLREMFSDLPLFLFGASYAAHTALEAARGAVQGDGTVPAGVLVLVPALGRAETAWTARGVAQLEHRIAWWHEHGTGPRSREPLTAVELRRRVERASGIGAVAAAWEWGWPPPVVARWEQLWLAQRIDLAERYGRLPSRLLVVTGDDDFFDDDARRLEASWGGDSHLVTGPWGHRLASDITDPQARARFTRSGGLATVIDDWLSADRSAPGNAETTATAGTRSRRLSVFDPMVGAWSEEEGTG